MEFEPRMTVAVKTKEKHSEEYAGDSPAHQFIAALKHMPKEKQIEAKKILAKKWKHHAE